LPNKRSRLTKIEKILTHQFKSDTLRVGAADKVDERTMLISRAEKRLVPGPAFYKIKESRS
jgi:hypothetical protein